MAATSKRDTLTIAATLTQETDMEKLNGAQRTKKSAEKYLIEDVRYDPETGHLYDIPTGARICYTEANENGMKRGMINGERIYAHRAIWFIHKKEWPDRTDWINGDKSDNRIENLRSLTHSQTVYKARRAA